LNPIADFSITSPDFTTDYEGTAPVNAHFINLSQNYDNPNSPSGLPTFFWNFDNQQDGTGWILTHEVTDEFDTTYTVGDEYLVCLVAINKNGCTDTLCKTVVVYDPLLFVAVNVFTPDNDGVNDLFTFDLRADAVSEFNCVIVNRWGVEVFEMNNIADAWDGKDKNGSDCKDGVYFYTYSGKADNGDPFVGQGTVSILRE
jgi:gliding motility-associated-like protein